MQMNETTIYYIIMLFIYSGLLPWVMGQLTRSRSDDRIAARAEVDASLALIERLRTARAASMDAERQASIDLMINRLQREADERIIGLNAAAELESSSPSRRYIVIPTPRTAFGAFLTVLFVGAAYMTGVLLLTIAFDFWNPPVPDLLRSFDDRLRIGLLVAGSLAVVLLAMGLRSLAYRNYNRAAARLHEEAAKARAAAGTAA